jgi:protein-tyrosine-phosphatase
MGAAHHVLFLCTGNSARSLLAEAVLNARGAGAWRAFSAGSRPQGEPHPMAIETLQGAGYDTDTLRSKSWDEFSAEGAPELNLVITLCDSAAAETCPVWPGAPLASHWGLPDPAAQKDPQACRRAFAETLARIEQAVTELTDLPVEQMSPTGLKTCLDAIGQHIHA